MWLKRLLAQLAVFFFELAIVENLYFRVLAPAYLHFQTGLSTLDLQLWSRETNAIIKTVTVEVKIVGYIVQVNSRSSRGENKKSQKRMINGICRMAEPISQAILSISPSGHTDVVNLRLTPGSENTYWKRGGNSNRNGFIM